MSSTLLMQMWVWASRQYDSKDRAFAGFAIKFKFAAMFVNYSCRDGESQASAAFAFGAKERIENALLNFMRNASSGVGNLQDGRFSPFAVEITLGSACA